MYDILFNKNEEIQLISDDTKIYIQKTYKTYTCIITNQRLLILDYPSSYHNSKEDLRISGKMPYIRKKEVISSVDLKDIISIDYKNKYCKINIKDDKYININDTEVINYLKKVI